jgi:hypothetical protein
VRKSVAQIINILVATPAIKWWFITAKRQDLVFFVRH